MAVEARVNAPAHSKQNDPGFLAELRAQPEHLTMNHIVAVSPDGQWLLLPGHLASVRSLKVVAELPMICLQAGFMADSKTIYVVDPVRKQVGFFDIEELQRRGASRP
jgi:hypothetical protein